jgi:hypothetical protein
MARTTKKIVKIDKYTKVEPKIHPITLAAIILSIISVFVLVIVSQPSNSQTIYKAYDPYVTSEYFTEDHPFYQVTYNGSLFKNGFEKIVDKEEIVVLYLGFQTCPACQATVGPIQRYFNSTGFNEVVSKIYYINPTIDIKGATDLSADFPAIGVSTPQLIVFQNGQIIASYQYPENADAIQINRTIRDFFEGALTTINS